jgi:multiple sugar transport system permease protein
LFVTLSVVLGQVICCSLAGYAFARLRFPGRDVIFLLYLGTLMVPFMVVLVPLFVIIRTFGWLDRYEALIIPALFGGAYGTFLMRQFMMTLPQELADAATIDGCDPFGIFWHVFLPLTRPAVATLAVFTFIAVWNDFLWANVVTHSVEMKTLNVGVAYFGGLTGIRFNLMMAVATIGVIPTLIAFLFAQRYFVEGITLSGLKG